MNISNKSKGLKIDFHFLVTVKFDGPIKPGLKLLVERWSSDPKDRPTFRELFHKLSFQLEDDDDTIETHLCDLVS